MILPTTYQTRSGDYFDLISFRLYGTEYFSDALCYANPAYANVWVFDAGVTLTVPQITPINNIPTPPWMQIGQITQGSSA